MEKLLVSACLLGENCRYDGTSKAFPAIDALRKKYELIPVCPEFMGGLPIPRHPNERKGRQVFTSQGVDVTIEFDIGAKLCLFLAQENHVVGAVLKERSPSCGVHAIYDGTFSKTIVPGMGMTAELLKAYGYPVYSEEEIASLL